MLRFSYFVKLYILLILDFKCLKELKCGNLYAVVMLEWLLSRSTALSVKSGSTSNGNFEFKSFLAGLHLTQHVYYL